VVFLQIQNQVVTLVLMFLDWQFTARDDEHLDPARYQYREALILVDAIYREMPVMWHPVHLCGQ
jgi:hypothetical protein